MVHLDSLTLLVVVVFFGATLLRSALGFGEALIAVPLLAFAVPVKVAAPVAALASVTVAASVLIQDWRHVRLDSALRLIGPTLVGIPIGLLLLTRAPERLVKAGLALVILGFAAQALNKPHWRLESERFAWFFGLVAGVLGGAYGMNGPPLAMYGALRRWSPAEFRATLQGYFLPASAMGIAGYWMAGLWTPGVTRFYLASLPGILTAIVAGRYLNRRISAGRFTKAVYTALLVVGLLLLTIS